MIGLLKYVVREPEKDEHKTGYKYPFNAAEILSSENSYLLDKFFEDSNNSGDEDKYEELDEEEAGNEANRQNEERIEGDSEAEKTEELFTKIENLGENKEYSEDVEMNEIEEDIQVAEGETKTKEEEDRPENGRNYLIN